MMNAACSKNVEKIKVKKGLRVKDTLSNPWHSWHINSDKNDKKKNNNNKEHVTITGVSLAALKKEEKN